MGIKMKDDHRGGKVVRKQVGLVLWSFIVASLHIIGFAYSTMAQDSPWIPIGPEGGFPLSLAIAPNSPNVLFAGSDKYGGIYRSTDSGENWAFMDMLWDLGEVLDIAIHPDVPDIVYAACSRGGVFKTTDGGLNWDRVFKRKGMFYSLGVDPNAPDVIYTGLIVGTAAEYALYKSTDGGITWPDSSFQGNPVLKICFDPDSLSTLYAGTSYGVHRSTDGGTSWIFCGPPGPSATIQSLVVADFNTFYAGSAPDTRDDGTVYKTTDGGGTWNISYDMGDRVWDLAVDPNDVNILYMAAGNPMFGHEGVFKTTDGGDSWFPVNNGLVDRMAREIRIDPNSPNIVYVATNGLGGVYKSVDRAESWTQTTSGMRYTLVQAMCFDASQTLYAAIGWGTYRDFPSLFKSRDRGISWESLTVIPSPYYLTSLFDIVTYPDSSDLIYVGGVSHNLDTAQDSTRGLLYRSRDGGGTWEALWTPESKWILCLAIDPVSNIIYAGTGGGALSRIYGLFRSTDGGETWEETSGLQSPGNSIFDIAIDPISPNRIYAGTGGAVFMSDDYGVNWTPLAIIPFAYTLLIDPNSSNIIYAGSGGPYADRGGVYKSTDSGLSWEIVGLEAYAITSLVGNFGAGNTIYAGTGGKFLETTGNGVFSSADNGTSWEPMNWNLTSPYILSMLIGFDSPNMMYAGTMGGGIFKTSMETGITVGEEGVNLETTTSLSNSPNPFNATTHIGYQILKTGPVSLRIYDISGGLVAILIDDFKQAGYHRITWDGLNHSGVRIGSGVYFVHLRIGHEMVTRKIVFTK